MRVHVVNVMRPNPGETGRTLDRIAGLARQVEARGFTGLWVTDSFGRGRATLDPIVLLSVIAAVTQKIEIGTCVLQAPVRHPLELAHRIQSLHALTGDRLKPGGGRASVMLTGGEAAARDKLRWIQEVGFDDVLCMAMPESLDDLARLRDAL